jgi:hypothetical protein
MQPASLPRGQAQTTEIGSIGCEEHAPFPYGGGDVISQKSRAYDQSPGLSPATGRRPPIQAWKA